MNGSFNLESQTENASSSNGTFNSPMPNDQSGAFTFVNLIFLY